MNVDHSLSWHKTMLLDTFMQKLEAVSLFVQGWIPTVALRKRRMRLRHSYFHLRIRCHNHHPLKQVLQRPLLQRHHRHHCLIVIQINSHFIQQRLFTLQSQKLCIG